MMPLQALNVWVERDDPPYQIVREDGTILVITAASEGVVGQVRRAVRAAESGPGESGRLSDRVYAVGPIACYQS